MSLRNHASIARIVLALADAIDDEGDGVRIAAGVLSRAPGDDAPRLVRRIAEAMGVEPAVIRAQYLDRPQAAVAVTSEAVKVALASDMPTMMVIDGAHEAGVGVLRAIVTLLADLPHTQPCLILAISTSPAEAGVAAAIADGLGVDESAVVMHRTADENRRLLDRVLGAMA